MNGERRRRSTEAFYGRRHGKTLRPQQAEALQKGLPRYGIDLTAPAPADLRELFSVPLSEVRLEIGFGGGEHLLNDAAINPGSGLIGVEPFINGMAKLMTILAERPGPNVRVFNDDATQLLDWLPSASLEGIALLYPDPWPKKKHWKRRFVSAINLDRFARVLKPGGVFRFASDIDTYVNWTLLHCRAHPAFEWQAGAADNWHLPYPDWPGTRYEAKALREGRTPAYLTFVRT
ncbi:tRNA (guanine-N7-)-methyltransferase [Mesorhizobium albiziae]|uniref:tRNA (guanine-N(7)-)-methyltransferase n=1 Tax=Neomesorhizobium albiziae TaxID=335020 RepID=A0A1I3WI50_9HYPH|nr:tRNA (guanosine(46)-N(7))-methyltransferase TrmB [Mesorhizobium albiziae]GLS31621.1 tRNA (guanine-N(7)-)-methyltransferase [Mesorhizobium albiziae]SFK06843.1 tRNA (guanine-N7-)-methyltransferase [Mesorhizobium albiziae]